jgi:uracil-DNA glycosylase
MAGTPLVTDRSHLSEPIYGPIMRDGTVMTYRVEALLERYFEAIDAQIVICLPPYRTAFNNWVVRKGSEYVQKSTAFRKIYDAYTQLLFNQKRNRNFVWFDFTRHDAESFAGSLMRVSGYPLPPDVVGSQRPRFLFVGERPGNSDSDMHNYAFLSVDNCSGWLFDRLNEAGYQEHEIAFTNAFRRDGTSVEFEQLVAYLKGKGLSRIIALGKVAEEALTAQSIKDGDGLDVVVSPHPQYVKRFQGKDLAAYVYSLKELRRGAK